jgi:hypothetical protein
LYPHCTVNNMNPKIEKWLFGLDADFQEVASAMISLVMTTHPGMIANWKYGVPYFECNGVVCFFNKKKEGIDVGFMKGHRMPKDLPMLEDRGLKLVRHIVMPRKPSIEHFDAMSIALNEAVLLNLK